MFVVSICIYIFCFVYFQSTIGPMALVLYNTVYSITCILVALTIISKHGSDLLYQSIYESLLVIG